MQVFPVPVFALPIFWRRPKAGEVSAGAAGAAGAPIGAFAGGVADMEPIKMTEDGLCNSDILLNTFFEPMCAYGLTGHLKQPKVWEEKEVDRNTIDRVVDLPTTMPQMTRCKFKFGWLPPNGRVVIKVTRALVADSDIELPFALGEKRAFEGETRTTLHLCVVNPTQGIRVAEDAVNFFMMSMLARDSNIIDIQPAQVMFREVSFVQSLRMDVHEMMHATERLHQTPASVEPCFCWASLPQNTVKKTDLVNELYSALSLSHTVSPITTISSIHEILHLTVPPPSLGTGTVPRARAPTSAAFEACAAIGDELARALGGHKVVQNEVWMAMLHPTFGDIASAQFLSPNGQWRHGLTHRGAQSTTMVPDQNDAETRLHNAWKYAIAALTTFDRQRNSDTTDSRYISSLQTNVKLKVAAYLHLAAALKQIVCTW